MESNRQVVIQMLNSVVEEKITLYGQVLINKLSATCVVDIAPSGEVIGICGDSRQAIVAVLRLFKEISGKAGLSAAKATLKTFALNHLEIRDEVEEALREVQ